MKGNSLNVLMLGGARRVSLSELLRQSGARLGQEIKLFSYELFKEVPVAAVAQVIVGRKWSDPDVVDDIVRVCREHDIDIILPFVDGAIEIASKCIPLLPDVFIPVSEYDVCKTMFDKVAAAAAYKQAGIPVPTAYTPLTASVPAIAKPRFGSASRGIKVFHNMEDLMQLENFPEYLVQEYIAPREEYTVDCYVSRDDEILCTVPRLRAEVMGGEVTRTVTRRIPELITMSRDVINAFGLRGPVTLQFIRDLARERYLLMEINPRLGGGVVCSVYAGAPITDYILQESLGIPLKTCDDWSDNTLMTRYLKEVIFYKNK